MAPKKRIPDPELLHQWEIIEAKRAQINTGKKVLSVLAGKQESYYYQAEKNKWPIGLEVLTTWAEELDIPISSLFLEGAEDPKAKLIRLVQQADAEKLPQALRILEAFLVS